MFLDILKAEVNYNFGIHTVMYFRFCNGFPEKFINSNSHIRLQIIVRHENFQHWMVKEYDPDKYFRIYDSVNRNNVSQLRQCEIVYLTKRYPRMDWDNSILLCKCVKCIIYARMQVWASKF